LICLWHVVKYKELEMTDFTSSAALVEEVRRLRQSVERLEAAAANRCIVKLKTLREPYFLGQPVVVSAMVCAEKDGCPMADTPVTFTTTWGKLQRIGGHPFRNGNTLKIRTGADGTAAVILLPQTEEHLSEEQQAALEVCLQYLDSHAITPKEVETGLQKMVRQYQWDAGKQMVQAIDIYFREFSRSLLETINHRDHMLAWSHFDAMVTAFTMEEDPGKGSEATVNGFGAMQLLLKDWLGPWLQTYLASEESEKLRQEVRDAKEWGDGDVDFILDGIYNRVDKYLDKQQGVVGRYVGEQVVENTMREFLKTDLTDLTLEARVRLFPGIRAAVGTTSFTGAGTMLTTTRQTRVAFDSFRTHLDSQADQALKGIRQTFADERDNFLKGFQAGADAVQNNGLEKFGRDIDSVRNDGLNRFQTDVVKVRGEGLTQFQTDVVKVRGEGLTQFQTDVVKVRGEGLTRFQTDVVKVRGEGLTQFQTDVVKVRGEGLNQFQTDVVKVRGEGLTRFQDRCGQGAR
jgi:hypothetical protein